MFKIPNLLVIFCFCIYGIVAIPRNVNSKESEVAKPISIEDSAEEYDESENSDSFEDTSGIVSTDVCRSGCPRIFDPICAVDDKNSTNYKYFHNQCLMEYESCRKENVWKPTHMLHCLADIDPLIRDDCLRPCPFIYEPVCASDGENFKIFGNRCIFGMENCLASGTWLEVRGELCGF